MRFTTEMCRYLKCKISIRLTWRDGHRYVLRTDNFVKTKISWMHRVRSIQPKFRPVRPGKVDHLKGWTSLIETFPVGLNRSIEFWTEISGNLGWIDGALDNQSFLPHCAPLRPLRARELGYLTIIPWAWMGSESIAHEAKLHPVQRHCIYPAVLQPRQARV